MISKDEYIPPSSFELRRFIARSFRRHLTENRLKAANIMQTKRANELTIST